MMSTVWKEIIHRDDATDEEKGELVEEIRNSPPISPTHAFFHPFMLVQAHRKLKRYRGETWFWPRFMWLATLGVSGFLAYGYFSDLPTDATPDQKVIYILFGLCVGLPLLALISHTFATTIRLNETCVWCNIAYKTSKGSIEATLSIMVYRLPFLDPSRENPTPWQKTWWKSTDMYVVLETKRDISQLNLSDIYDERVCKMRPLVAVPPKATRYAVRKVEPYGDVAIKEKGRFIPRVSPQTLVIFIGALTGAAALLSALVALWQAVAS